MSITTADIDSSNTDVYTSSGNTAITWASFTSSNASTVTVDIHVVPSGDSVGNTNLVANSVEIVGGDTYQLYAGGEKLLLENGDKVTAVANVANVVHSVISYTSV